MPSNAQLLARLHRRANTLEPEMRATYLRAYRMIRESLSTSEWTKAIQSGEVDALLTATLSESALTSGPLAEFRARVQAPTMGAGTSAFNSLPKKVSGAGAFNALNPRVLDSVVRLESRVVATLSREVAETVRQHVAAGMNAGKAPPAIARGIRDVVGLAPNQELAVSNFQAALEAGDISAFNRKLRDKRFDRTLSRARRADGTYALTQKQVDTMTAAYRRKWIAHNAQVNAKTFALDAQRLAQRNAWQSAIGDGFVDPNLLQHTWVDSGDGKVRDEHAAMNGETVPFDQPYSNGQMFPGETDFNCRCTERFTERKP